MPRAEKIRKSTANKLLQVAQEKGQKSISGFFRGSDNNLNAQEQRATGDVVTVVDDTVEDPESDSGRSRIRQWRSLPAKRSQRCCNF